MKFYVAGAWVEQHERARPMIKRLVVAGLECTCDWTRAEGEVARKTHERAPLATGHVGDIEMACGHCGAPWPNEGEPPVTPCAVMKNDDTYTREDRLRFATADLDGVLTADLFVLLAPDSNAGAGCWVELGAALTHRKMQRYYAERLSPLVSLKAAPHVIVAGKGAARSIFTELADELVPDDEAAFRAVMAYVGTGQPGWGCRACGVFNGEMKERLSACRSCGLARTA